MGKGEGRLIMTRWLRSTWGGPGGGVTPSANLGALSIGQAAALPFSPQSIK